MGQEETRVASHWSDIAAWLTKHEVVQELPPPASRKAIAACEKALGRALPESLRSLLAIHNGGRSLFGGADLLDLDGIVQHVTIQRRFKPARDRRGLLPFVIDGYGDYLVLDKKGVVLDAPHDADDESRVAPTLEAWLERVARAMMCGDVRYDPARGLFPSFGGEKLAFLDDAYVVLEGDAAIEIDGPAELTVSAVEGTLADVGRARFELVEGTKKKAFDVAAEAKLHLVKHRVTVTGPKLTVRKSATLRAREGVGAEDTVWIHFVGRPIPWRRTRKGPAVVTRTSRSPRPKPAVDSVQALLREPSEFGVGSGGLWGMLDAPNTPLPSIADAPAIIAATLKRRRKFWGDGRSPAAKRIMADMYRVWGGRSKNAQPTREVDAALAKMLCFENDAALPALIATWIARGGIDEAFAVVGAMNELDTFLSSGRLGIKVAPTDSMSFPISSYLARELGRVAPAERERLKTLAAKMRAAGGPWMRLGMLRIFLDPTWAVEDAALSESDELGARAAWVVFRAAADPKLAKRALAAMGSGAALFPGLLVARLGREAIPILKRHVAEWKGSPSRQARELARALSIAETMA